MRSRQDGSQIVDGDIPDRAVRGADDRTGCDHVPGRDAVAQQKRPPFLFAFGDILAGVENGLPTAAACFGYGTPEEWAHADFQARTVPELRAWLEDFCRRTPRK